MSRTAERVLTWAVERRDEEADEAPLADSIDGPPAHWLATVRAKAPWLLAEQRYRPRAVVLRPAVPAAPEQTPAPDPGPQQDPRPANVVYKERNARNATPKPGERTPPEPVRLRAPSPGPSPAQGLERSSPAGSPAEHHPPYRPVQPEKSSRGREFPGWEKAPGGQRPLGRETTPDGQRPPSPGAPARPQSSERSREGSRELTLKVPPTAPAEQGERPRAAMTSAQLHGGGNVPRVFQSHPIEARPGPRPHQVPPTGPPQPRPVESARPEESRRPTARFHPVLWGERGREYPAQSESATDSTNGLAEDPWPQLPEWGWQQWQMDPIQRQFRELDRRARLRAEQAGSSWSGPHS